VLGDGHAFDSVESWLTSSARYCPSLRNDAAKTSFYRAKSPHRRRRTASVPGRQGRVGLADRLHGVEIALLPPTIGCEEDVPLDLLRDGCVSLMLMLALTRALAPGTTVRAGLSWHESPAVS
jgi:hypothetical protein